MRIEQIGGATLYLGDCLEILPTLGKVDAVVTDPPYGVGFKGQIENDGRKSRGGYENFADDDPEYIIRRAIAAIDIATRAIVMPGIRLLHDYPKPADIGVFFVPGGVGRGPWGFCCSNPILYYGKRPPRPGCWPTSYADNHPMPSSFDHPVAKPMEWMMRLVNIGSLEGETILDPFMGSGTTGVACANLGRKFIGIEIEPKYFDIACRRISDAYKQPRLFKDEKPMPKQAELLEVAK